MYGPKDKQTYWADVRMGTQTVTMTKRQSGIQTDTEILIDTDR